MLRDPARSRQPPPQHNPPRHISKPAHPEYRMLKMLVDSSPLRPYFATWHRYPRSPSFSPSHPCARQDVRFAQHPEKGLARSGSDLVFSPKSFEWFAHGTRSEGTNSFHRPDKSDHHLAHTCQV